MSDENLPGDGSSVPRWFVVLTTCSLLGVGLAAYVWNDAFNRGTEAKIIAPSPNSESGEATDEVSRGSGEGSGGTNTADANPIANANVSVHSDSVVTIDGDLDSVDWNGHRNHVVQISGELVVIDTFDLARRGQLRVARARLYVPTSLIDPNDADASKTSVQGGSNVAKVTSVQKKNDQGAITLDDGIHDQNVFPFTLLPEVGRQQKSIRVGSKLTDLTARVVEVDGKLVLIPVDLLTVDFAPRPKRPSLGEANVTIASFNVLNYFTTIDDGQNNARGADSPEEFERQKSKIVAAILGLDADVVGLMEIENNREAEQDLVAALNAKAGSELYAGVGVPKKLSDAPGGSDAIRVGMVYRADRVSPVGSVELINDFAFVNARTPLVQRFRRAEGSDEFSVIVNHFKSKGGNARGGDKNKGDGQGAFNESRKRQATALTKYIESRQVKDAGAHIIIIGDLNAYQEEDPIDMLRAAGLVDLSQQSDQDSSKSYSYVYYGQSGSLDHAFATLGLAELVTGVATWHINADEPRWLDYNLEYNPKTLFEATPFRSSDHDPVLIGIRLD